MALRFDAALIAFARERDAAFDQHERPLAFAALAERDPAALDAGVGETRRVHAVRAGRGEPLEHGRRLARAIEQVERGHEREADLDPVRRRAFRFGQSGDDLPRATELCGGFARREERHVAVPGARHRAHRASGLAGKVVMPADLGRAGGRRAARAALDPLGAAAVQVLPAAAQHLAVRDFADEAVVEVELDARGDQEPALEQGRGALLVPRAVERLELRRLEGSADHRSALQQRLLRVGQRVDAGGDHVAQGRRHTHDRAPQPELELRRLAQRRVAFREGARELEREERIAAGLQRCELGEMAQARIRVEHAVRQRLAVAEWERLERDALARRGRHERRRAFGAARSRGSGCPRRADFASSESISCRDARSIHCASSTWIESGASSPIRSSSARTRSSLSPCVRGAGSPSRARRVAATASFQSETRRPAPQQVEPEREGARGFGLATAPFEPHVAVARAHLVREPRLADARVADQLEPRPGAATGRREAGAHQRELGIPTHQRAESARALDVERRLVRSRAHQLVHLDRLRESAQRARSGAHHLGVRTNALRQEVAHQDLAGARRLFETRGGADRRTFGGVVAPQVGSDRADPDRTAVRADADREGNPEAGAHGAIVFLARAADRERRACGVRDVVLERRGRAEAAP